MKDEAETLDISSFTVVLPENARKIPVEAVISQYDHGDGDNVRQLTGKPRYRYTGIIDTGAMRSCISEKVAQDLSLVDTGYVVVDTANGKCRHSCHVVNFSLPNAVIYIAVQVTSGNIGVDFLLGMDILNLGDFHITHRHGFKVVEFHTYNIVHSRKNNKPHGDQT